MGIHGAKLKEILPGLIKRSFIFFLLIDSFTIFLYALGIIREFTDATQLLLLGLSRIFGISLAINGFCGIVVDLRLTIRQNSLRFIPGMILYFFVGLLGGLNAVFSAIIIVLSGGTGG